MTALNKIIDILVPDIGDYKNVLVIDVAVKAGDEIKKEDTLITLETDKAAMDIPSAHSGIIKSISLKVNDKVSQGDKIISLEIAEAVPASFSEPIIQNTEQQTQSKTQSSSLIDIYVPDIGDYKNVLVIDVAVKAGDEIKKEGTLISLETDKAAMDIPSTHTGKIKSVYVKANDKVSQGDKIVSIEVEAHAAPAQAVSASPKPEVNKAPQKIETTPAVLPPVSVSVASMTSGEVYAGPATRRAARELGVDLTKVTGTGRKNRIISTDVFQYVKAIMTGQSNAPGMNTGTGLSIAPDPDIDFTKFGEIESKPLLRIKKLTAANLHRNWVKIPHVTQFEETDVTELEAFRQDNQAEAQKRGLKLTPLVFIIKAVVSALKAYPQFNASLSKNGEELIYKKYINVGVAVDTPNGLVVPVVKQADTKSLFDLSHELAVLSQKAREGKLTGQEMQGGCFSISSLGGIGGTMFTPIINAPELAILGVSKTQIKPVWDETTNSFVPRKILPLSLSYDHRVIDGAEAARFIVHLAKQLQDIRKLLL